MRSNNVFQRYFSLRFRHLLSGASDGNPPWLSTVASGNDAGLFLPTDAPWVIHRDFGTLIGGIRALLMQALHPGPLSGVMQHSRYESDPLGRLSGTIRWLTVTTFGSTAAVADEAKRVNRLHDRVAGTFIDASDVRRDYRASDTKLLLWVHISFMESFLVAHEKYVGTPIPAGDLSSGADNYIHQWARSVKPLGLAKAPHSREEMNRIIDEFRESGEVRVTEETRQIIEFIRKPPLPRAAIPIYRVLFDAAVISLRPDFRDMLNLHTPADWWVSAKARLILRALRIAVGPESPIEEAAINRLQRLGVLS